MTSSRAWFVVHPQGLVVRRAEDRVELPTDDDADALGLLDLDAHELGAIEGVQAVAASIGDGPLAPPFEVGRLRELYPLLGDARFLMAGRATQVVEWSTTHKFCGRCATATERVATERCMRCPSCGLLAYPRIYFGSQPWPFPHSLMVGFFAEWAAGEIRADGREILDAHWFRTDQLPMIPPPLSIARRLIDAWVAGAPQSS